MQTLSWCTLHVSPDDCGDSPGLILTSSGDITLGAFRNSILFSLPFISMARVSRQSFLVNCPITVPHIHTLLYLDCLPLLMPATNHLVIIVV